MIRMLQDKYLPKYDIATQHEILINAKPDKVYDLLNSLDFSSSRIIYWLFKLRGIPVPSSMTLQGLQQLNFNVLEKVPGHEILIGIIGLFWTLKGGLLPFKKNEFIPFEDPNYAKATWSFTIMRVAVDQVYLRTETRIHIESARARKKFRLYWFLVGPFSGLIRREILQIIKREAHT